MRSSGSRRFERSDQLLTTNPIGSVLAHASMHVAAATHAYETPTFLPPQVTADGRREAPRNP